jgi:hypothetical protein
MDHHSPNTTIHTQKKTPISSVHIFFYSEFRVTLTHLSSGGTTGLLLLRIKLETIKVLDISYDCLHEKYVHYKHSMYMKQQDTADLHRPP